MFDLEIFGDIAIALVTVLVAVLGVYFALRFLGKVAKIVVSILIVIVVLWLLLSNGGVLGDLFAVGDAPLWLLR